MVVETSHCGVSNGFTHGFISLSDRIHHPDRVHTRPYVMSHLRCWHVPTIMHYEFITSRTSNDTHVRASLREGV